MNIYKIYKYNIIIYDYIGIKGNLKILVFIFIDKISWRDLYELDFTDDFYLSFKSFKVHITYIVFNIQKLEKEYDFLKN